ncbi:MAG: D-alanine--D-alanine ligase [Patescibacteria group bacterium]|jgi:D-alanine-D-alanine ligase|nr:D-alanine--D-alanine ligase [Patescibacteria group bacterium]
MKIALTYNLRKTKKITKNKKVIENIDFDDPKTILGIKKALQQLGYKVFLIEADEKAYFKFYRLRKKIDLVFNYSEGLYGKDREAQIPAMLEMLQIPYTGGSPLSYAIGLNKVKTKEILAYHQIPTPKWQVFKNNNEQLDKKLKFPLLAKPQSEGSSKGIFAKNLVNNEKELRKIVRELLKKFKQPVLVEEFLNGREFTVGVLGCPPKILPIIEVRFDELPRGVPKFDHFEAKWLYDNPKFKADPLICPAPISQKLQKEIEKIVLRAFDVLELADWARFDIRLDKNNTPNILEVNCPAGLNPDPKENSRFPRAARVAGLNFSQLLNGIIKSAVKRLKIKLKK